MDINTEEYFEFIDDDYLEELSLISKDEELQTDFKVAYLILFFQLSKSSKSGDGEKGILLGDLFISILTRRLICRNRLLLSKIMKSVSA